VANQELLLVVEKYTSHVEKTILYIQTPCQPPRLGYYLYTSFGSSVESICQYGAAGYPTLEQSTCNVAGLSDMQGNCQTCPGLCVRRKKGSLCWPESDGHLGIGWYVAERFGLIQRGPEEVGDADNYLTF
jgi:hypothetical protein